MYLSEDRHVAMDRVFIKGGGNQSKVKKWLAFIDDGKVRGT